jgi:hypothetical protein
MLVLYDRGLHSCALLSAIRARGAHALVRLPTSVRFAVLRTLADGTVLGRLQSRRPRRNPPILARVVRYTLDDPTRTGHRVEHRLITTLLDPRRVSALDFICAYHARWEFEIAADEIKIHLRPPTPLRSHSPVGVVQEVFGLLIAHYVIRAVMTDAAATVNLPPTRLSFLYAVRLIRSTLPDLQRARPAERPRLYRGLLADLAAIPLPPRSNRINPRAVKQKMSNFPRKRLTAPCPARTCPFRETVRLLK